MFQLVSIASRPTAVHLREESGSIFSVSSSQAVADAVCSSLSLLFLRPYESSFLNLSASIMFPNPCLA